MRWTGYRIEKLSFTFTDYTSKFTHTQVISNAVTTEAASVLTGLRSPKGVWTTGRQGGGSASPPGLRSSDSPRDPPLGQRLEPEVSAPAPASGS